MSNITVTDVKAFQDNLKSDLETIAALGHVNTRRRLIANRKDYFDKLAIDGTDESEICFTEIEFLRFQDSPDEGGDDCPVAILSFGLHIFRQFVDLRSDNSNSADDFLNAILSIRKHFLEGNREYSAGSFIGVIDPVEMPDFAQFGNDTLTDAVGQIGDLNLTVRFYDA